MQFWKLFQKHNHEEKLKSKKRRKYQKELSNLYKEILHREADTIGFKHFLARLMDDRINIERVRDDMMNSQEYSEMIVLDAGNISQKKLMKFPLFFKNIFSNPREKYLEMQKLAYKKAAGNSRFDSQNKIDWVVGNYEKHNQWKDYDEYLMKYVDESFKNKISLDFGCGPGRNIVKYNQLFKRIDGCDIAPGNIENCKKNLRLNNLLIPNLYVTKGDDLGNASENFYDFIFSTITLQHICVHKIRSSIFRCMFKSLKRSGRISIQMGFGKDHPDAVGYYSNKYSAKGTNGACDAMIENVSFIKKDLEQNGFTKFEYWIRPVGPGDRHCNWIFFTAVK